MRTTKRNLRILACWMAVILASAPAVWAVEEQPKSQPPTQMTTQMTDDELEELFLQAVMLSAIGMDEEAVQRCQQILAQKPDQPTAKRLLREIQAKRQKAQPSAASAKLRTKLERTIVPEVNFRDANPADVIEFLRKESPKRTADKTAINFVWMVPPEVKPRPVTLTLKDVPMLDVLQYATEGAGLRYRVDPNAIVIYSQAAPASSADAESPAR